MSYIDLYHDRDREVVSVVERDKNGKRQIQEFPANYTLYYEDHKGKYRSLDEKHLNKFSTRKRAEYEREKRIHHNKLYESDISPGSRCLSENYRNADIPVLHTCFFDIEVAMDPDKGFSSPEEALNQVTAISLFLDWTNQLITLVMAPNHMGEITSKEIVAGFENTMLFTSEAEMFEVFFQLIEDADVISGWNSEGYDIPYMVNRCIQIMSKADTRKFCLLGQLPKVRKYERFGKEESTYDLIGRIHVDYLQLYKKFNYENRHSYKLDAIAELELGEHKTEYDGTLDQLYNKDFPKFIEYNRQDTMLVYKIHHKLQFLELANQMAHENTVLLPAVMGTVALVEMAVMNEAHDHGLIVPDKQRKNNDAEQTPAAGAYVATPKKGIHEWVGAVDINSLYPSTIRVLNMAPETIVGQLRPTITDRYMQEKGARLAREKKQFKEGDDDVGGAVLWEGLFGSLEYTAVMNQEPGAMITIDYEDGREVEMSAADIWQLVFNGNKQWMLSANGTIFSYEKEGVIPGLLSKWYADRKTMQAKYRQATTPEERAYWDKRQLVRKILLNSAYGALLNQHCRFFDKRLGQSVTLCGRQIVRHMSAQINESITGEYDYTGDAIVYGDTDSCYFSAWPMIRSDVESGSMSWSKEMAIQLYDTIAEGANESFPAFMEKAFHVPRRQGEIIKAGRELVADRSLFITKKRYAVNIYDKEGKRLDNDGPGKIKAMGLDLKRSDTPKYIQEFLMDILKMVLYGSSKESIVQKVREYKEWMALQDPWTKGSPKGVNKLTSYHDKLAHSKSGKVTMPGHVRASLNWNTLRRLHNDNYSMKIVDGSRIMVCKLRDNPMEYTSIALPTDETRIPQWFKDLPFDVAGMEKSLIDDKLENLLGVLGWDLRQDTAKTNVKQFFTFG